MSIINLNFLQDGALARIIGIESDSCKDKKLLKQVTNLGLVKGVIIEIMNSNLSGLMLLRINNSTFGISKELANSIQVKSI